MKFPSDDDRTIFKNGSINSYISSTKLCLWKTIENTDILQRDGGEALVGILALVAP